MSNYIRHRLNISSKSNCRENLLLFLKGDNGVLDFNKINPKPVWVVNNYKWSIESWGTKTNALNPRYYENDILFDTAWETPFELIKKVSYIFREPHFTLYWASEEIGFNVGIAKFKNGNKVYEKIYEPCSMSSYKAYEYITRVKLRKCCLCGVLSTENYFNTLKNITICEDCQPKFES